MGCLVNGLANCPVRGMSCSCTISMPKWNTGPHRCPLWHTSLLLALITPARTLRRTCPASNPPNAPPCPLTTLHAGVVWGWCVAGIAFLPLALLVLLSCPLARSLPALALALLATLAPLALADRAAYGRWTVSLLNFVRYNVVGGGDSALYGIEGPAFYLRNAAVNFQAGLALVMAAPLALPLAGGPPAFAGAGGETFLCARGRGRIRSGPRAWAAGGALLSVPMAMAPSQPPSLLPRRLAKKGPG